MATPVRANGGSCSPQELAHLPQASAFQGLSVATDAAGSLMVLGDAGDSTFGTSSGVVRVLAQQAGGWSLQATLYASDAAAFGAFGRSVALDAAGTTLLVGAEWDSHTSAFAGAAYVFTQSGATWTQQAKLVPAELAASDHFGCDVALNATGDVALIGARFHDVVAANCGAAFVFRFDGSTWTQEARLSAAASPSDQLFGRSVALDAAGDTALIGAPGPILQTGSKRIGRAHVFERDPGAGWGAVAELAAAAPALLDLFGEAVALDADGKRAFVGAPRADNSVAMLPGTVTVFSQAPLGWGLQATLSHAVAAPRRFGSALAVGAWGDVLVIGVPDEGLGGAGVYSFDGTHWSEVGLLAPSPTALNPKFGWSLAAPSKADRVLVGSGSSSQLDAAWEFSTPCDGPTTYCTGKVNSQGCVPLVSSSGWPSASAGSGFTIVGRFVVPAVVGLLFYGNDGPAAIPFQGGTLCVTPPIKRTPAQDSGDPGGVPCSGVFGFDFNVLIAAGSDPDLVPGAEVHAQYWFRDPPTPSTTGLSNAIQFVIAP